MSQTHLYLGIDANGFIYIKTQGYTYTFNRQALNTETCYVVSINITSEQLDLFLNGVHIQTLIRVNSLPDVQSTVFYLGQFFPNKNTTLDGRVNFIRIFNDIRTTSEIIDYQSASVPISTDGVITIFRFEVLDSIYSVSDFFGHHHMLPGGPTLNLLSRPTLTEDVCTVLPESIDTTGLFCSSTAPCTPPTSANELLCNGNFEQFCLLLYRNDPYWSGVFPPEPWLLPHHAFTQKPGTSVTTGSDVISWSPQSSNGGTPDFYVRNGIAWDPTNSSRPNPFFPGGPSNQIVTANSIQNPPIDTWNNQGDGIAALASISPLGGENIKNILVSPIEKDSTYRFSGWFYRTDAYWNFDIDTAGTGKITIYAFDGTFKYPLGSIFIPDEDFTSSSVNNWVHKSLTFTASSIPSNCSELVIEAKAPSGRNYIFLDDLSLKKINPNSVKFPQYIYTGAFNDYHHRVINTDNNGDIYVLLSAEAVNDSITLRSGKSFPQTTGISNSLGTYLVKFDSTGSVLWEEYYPLVEFTDFDFANNGEILAVGTNSEPISNLSSPPHSSQQNNTSSACLVGSINAHDTQQLIISRINPNTGSIIYEHSYGGTGNEVGLGIEIDQSENKAYILCQITGVGCDSINTNINSGLIWANLGGITDTRVLVYNVANDQPLTEYNSNVGDSKLLEFADNFLLSASDDTLYVMSYGSSYNLLNQTSIAGYEITDLSYTVTDTGSMILISYVDSNFFEVRDLWSLQSKGSFGYGSKMPLAIASSGNFAYIVLKQQPSNGSSTNSVMAIEKLKIDNLSSVWLKESRGYNTTTITNYASKRYTKAGDIVELSNGQKFAFVGNFKSLSVNWAIAFDNKVISDIPEGTYGNSFVSLIEDQGQTASFKRSNVAMEETIKTKSTLVYPNPVDNKLFFESTDNITKVVIVNSVGQVELISRFNADNRISFIDCSRLKNGLHIIYFYSDQNIDSKKFIKK